MFEPGQFSNYDSYLNDDEKEQEQEQEEGNIKSMEYKIKSPEELIKSYYESEMDEKDLYEMVINNDIALNLYQSLFKLKKGADRKLFKYPCQIKVYPKIKIMVIYIIVSHNFLRIKTELVFLKENKKYKKPDEKELKMKINSKSSGQSQESQSININKNYEEIDNESNKENEIIFTVELNDFYNMLDLLLCDNKDNPISISIDNNFSEMKGKAICPDSFNQLMFAIRFKYNLIKNEVFAYKINPPDEKNERKIIKKNFFDSNLNELNELENDKNSKNSESGNININNIQSKSVSQINQINDEESDYLEKRFTTDEKCAKYIIEGSDLFELYHLMKGLEPIYYDISTHTIGISMTNEKALFFCLAYENIHDSKSLIHLSKNIKHMTILNIKSVKNHFLTPFKYGFNSFYRSSLLSKFITSFYNKDDKRLLVKVSPSGKMILAYTFSDPKNDNEMNQMLNELDNDGIGISTEVYDNLNENNENRNNSDSNSRNRLGNNLKDRLLDDENRGNIVEMIFYPTVFDLCKN